MRTFQKVVSIIFYVIGGFTLSAANNMAFIDATKSGRPHPNPQGDSQIMFNITMVTVLVALAIIIVGGAINAFRNFRYGLSIVLLTVSGLGLFMILTMICINNSPEVTAQYPPGVFDIFGNYQLGGTLLVIELLFGIWLLPRKKA